MDLDADSDDAGQLVVAEGKSLAQRDEDAGEEDDTGDEDAGKSNQRGGKGEADADGTDTESDTPPPDPDTPDYWALPITGWRLSIEGLFLWICYGPWWLLDHAGKVPCIGFRAHDPVLAAEKARLEAAGRASDAALLVTEFWYSYTSGEPARAALEDFFRSGNERPTHLAAPDNTGSGDENEGTHAAHTQSRARQHTRLSWLDSF
jgi:hypothetical protein